MTGGGVWQCNNGHTTTQPLARYVTSVKVEDYTAGNFMSVFDECGEIVIGRKCDEVAAAWQNKDSDENTYTKMFEDANFRTFNFVVKSKKRNLPGRGKNQDEFVQGGTSWRLLQGLKRSREVVEGSHAQQRSCKDVELDVLFDFESNFL